jgi:hypothetical protein
MKKFETREGSPQGVGALHTKKRYMGLSASIHAHSVR